MAIVSQPPYRRYRASRFSHGGPPLRPRRRLRPLYVILGALLAVLVAIGAALTVLATSEASLVSDPAALARVQEPLGGGTVQSVVAYTGPHSRRVPVVLRGNRIWPKGRVPAGQTITIEVVVRRPGWISWLTGATRRLQLTVTAPTARLAESYVTLPRSAPLRVRFNRSVSVVYYGAHRAHLTKRLLARPSSVVTLPRTSQAGSMWILALPLPWERGIPRVVSWFPAGSGTAAVANPAPGATIRPHTSIVLTFSRPVARALGSSRPPVVPTTQGTWHSVNSHTIVFRPTGYGYGLGAKVSIMLPRGVRMVGGHATGSSEAASWTVPPGSTLRLQQLLATLGYLPLRFSGSSVALNARAQETAAIRPPHGRFSWRWGNIPSALRSMWKPGAYGVMTEGAVMAFENDHGLATVGVSNPLLWRYLIGAVLSGKRNPAGYNFVMVSEGSPESLTLWHDGKDLFTVPVNTGIASAPTALGTYPVYEHLPVTTMSGTNPDGSHYSDPGIPWVSYFNGGDALHGFYRAQYGFPQSLGCVEMNVTDAARVYPYTPVGTLVSVT